MQDCMYMWTCAKYNTLSQRPRGGQVEGKGRGQRGGLGEGKGRARGEREATAPYMPLKDLHAYMPLKDLHAYSLSLSLSLSFSRARTVSHSMWRTISGGCIRQWIT
jgi:hypothetical protein